MTLETYLIQHPKKHLIFDVDHTLAILEIDWTNIHQLLFDEIQKIDESLATKVTTNARDFYSLINKAVEKHGESAKKRTRSFMEQFENRNYAGYTPNKELLNFIRSHADAYIFSLWTSNATTTIKDFLHKENLSTLIKYIIGLDSIQFTKPNPEGFYHIYQKGEMKEDYLFVGDSDNDETAAKAAEIDFYKDDYFERLEALNKK